MKKFILLILCLLVLLPSVVSAHTHLSVSNPGEGQVIVDELKEITLTFDGNLEKLSSMQLVKNGSELMGLQVQLEADKMVGSLQNPLENGAYVIQWNIAGEDGHPITGEINFTVQKEEENEEQSTTVPDEGQDSSETNENDSVEVQIADDSGDGNEEAVTQNLNNSSENNKSNITMIITAIGFVIILGSGLLLFRKKQSS